VRRALAAAGLVLVAACSERPPIAPPPPGPERLARRFLPFDEGWIPEREIPRVPQSQPHMVIWEVSAWPGGTAPTPEQRRAADALAARCEAVARERGWFDFEAGLRDGFHLMPGDYRHYVNEEHLFDDVVLDCERPEFLMYYGTPQGKVLAGMMFYVARPDERGPQIGGPLTVWHYHVWAKAKCLRGGLLVTAEAVDGECAEGEPRFRSPEMLHVWFLDHPDGRFGTTMWLDRDDLAAALEQRAGEGS